MVALLAMLLLAARASGAGAGDVIGSASSTIVARGDSLIELARDHDLGFNEIAAANPALDAFVPTPGAMVVLPTQWIVPRAARRGEVVVNLSELRLYLLPRNGGAPLSFPVGIGVEANATPLSTSQVVAKVVNPTWYPPASIRREDPELPPSVPPGPENPLGTHALRLSRPGILIHGTNRPFGVGRRVSHGCLRLYPEDVPQLFEAVDVGTSVTIVREPVKVGARDGRIYVEVHDDPDANVDALWEATRLLARRDLLFHADTSALAAAVRERTGVPVDVTSHADERGAR